MIIGGGIIGSSISYNLVNDGFDDDILVIEKDSAYEFASSILSAGGVREQFSLPENIKQLIHRAFLSIVLKQETLFLKRK